MITLGTMKKKSAFIQETIKQINGKGCSTILIQTTKRVSQQSHIDC
jgi:hypothetical protein